MSGNRSSRRPCDTKPVVAASRWGPSQPRVCLGICTAGTPTEPRAAAPRPHQGLSNELIARRFTFRPTGWALDHAVVRVSILEEHDGDWQELDAVTVRV